MLLELDEGADFNKLYSLKSLLGNNSILYFTERVQECNCTYYLYGLVNVQHIGVYASLGDTLPPLAGRAADTHRP